MRERRGEERKEKILWQVIYRLKVLCLRGFVCIVHHRGCHRGIPDWGMSVRDQHGKLQGGVTGQKIKEIKYVEESRGYSGQDIRV